MFVFYDQIGKCITLHYSIYNQNKKISNHLLMMSDNKPCSITKSQIISI
ncbi:hypothetical protein A1OE_1060 [Candidatus Endolissoclinum faulkneri L2]|uniref:Uncharacterized protein n=1 Tax=Candidatus Endolissoclinum faulkneri L2 TaxID=1193729 RepID=K7Z5B2_9PROT|nr:hypothetical protein A1OE_1060 [Candidatus Endolissoclinum faulkneri L2]